MAILYPVLAPLLTQSDGELLSTPNLLVLEDDWSGQPACAQPAVLGHGRLAPALEAVHKHGCGILCDDGTPAFDVTWSSFPSWNTGTSRRSKAYVLYTSYRFFFGRACFTSSSSKGATHVGKGNMSSSLARCRRASCTVKKHPCAPGTEPVTYSKFRMGSILHKDWLHYCDTYPLCACTLGVWQRQALTSNNTA
jgi:hypothetical protein